MPALLADALITLGTLYAIGWVLACVVDATIARWPEAAPARDHVPPAPARWAALLLLWPLMLRAVLAPQRRRR